MGSRAQDALKRDASKQQMNVTLNRSPQHVSDLGSRILVAVDFGKKSPCLASPFTLINSDNENAGTTFSAAAWMWVGAVGPFYEILVMEVASAAL